MAAFVIKKLLERNPNIDQSRIYDVVLGCANQAGEDNRNIARMSALLVWFGLSRSRRNGQQTLRFRFVGSD
jgi:acetyl-CoA acetyltransferase